MPEATPEQIHRRANLLGGKTFELKSGGLRISLPRQVDLTDAGDWLGIMKARRMINEDQCEAGRRYGIKANQVKWGRPGQGVLAKMQPQEARDAHGDGPAISPALFMLDERVEAATGRRAVAFLKAHCLHDLEPHWMNGQYQEDLELFRSALDVLVKLLVR